MVCYNEGFFEKDVLNPKNVVWKAGTLVKTALMESMLTIEDSSAISEAVAEQLTTKLTKIRTIVVSFDQTVKKLVKVGDKLGSEDILCIIEDAVTSSNDLFDEQSLETLRMLGAQTPLSKAKGDVERVEIYYNGDKEDMSESLRALSNASDRDLAKRCKALGKPIFTGSVDEGFRVDGDRLAIDTLAIKIYITSDVIASNGDKAVFGNQMKTVIGKVFDNSVRTETGSPIGAIFGAKSCYDRIVTSPFLIGTTNTLLKVIARKAVEAYKK